ncbi:MAG: arsenite efflux transporter metallochaperone ArsD [Rhodobacteraceae bacterium]|nr:arsenite efflux transporter metallochaperone ArsD [Paracoccaceae bacterium]PHR51367.1 MAG: arsenical resistance operon transcriptional repressor ArsD [Robiginitomaculum sp.]
MTDVTVYDPAMCCSTGICGAEVDQRLVTFAADLDWLKSKGVAVTRINLSQEPARFAANETVKTVLEQSGVDGLPIVMVEGAMNSNGRYPDREELAGFANIAYLAEATIPESGTGCC